MKVANRTFPSPSADCAHLSRGIPITTPSFWLDDDSEGLIRHAFRSDSSTDLPLLDSRIACLREAGKVLNEVSQDESWYMACADSSDSGLVAIS